MGVRWASEMMWHQHDPSKYSVILHCGGGGGCGLVNRFQPRLKNIRGNSSSSASFKWDIPNAYTI